MAYTSAELINSRSARILSLIILLIVPSIISGLQIGLSTVNTGLRIYPSLIIAFTIFFYLFVTVIPTWSTFVNPVHNIKFEWFLMMVLLYLLWTTLLFTLGQVIWSFVVLVLLLIVSIFPLHAVFTNIHPTFSVLYLYIFLWILYLVAYQTYLLYLGEY